MKNFSHIVPCYISVEEGILHNVSLHELHVTSHTMLIIDQHSRTELRKIDINTVGVKHISLLLVKLFAKENEMHI